MILLIDNYDSFSYNLYQLVGSINPDIKVIRNDEMTIDEIKELNISHIIISPGPKRPENAGISVDVIKEFYKTKNILGVCLGHQAIAFAFNSTITYSKVLMHGKESEITVDTNDILFKGLDKTISVARYHSLAIKEDTLSSDFHITAKANDGEIMAIKHNNYNVFGVQFHPESIMTKYGEKIIKNFLEV